MVFQKNKKNTTYIFVALFIGVFFFLGIFLAGDAFAQSAAQNATAGTRAALLTGEPGSDNLFVRGIKWLLYILLWFLTGLVQVAANLFAWTTRPEYISGPTGLLNLVSVYELWKFIRDFFNLFFIFLLLFSAFATVFQLEDVLKMGIKKSFLKIIAAAIIINFSFPITRIIIDIGNVPMYFFAEGLVNATNNGSGNAVHAVTMNFFQSTGMSQFFLNDNTNPEQTGTLLPLLQAVVFTFIFMITLFTLSILFVIRLLKLVIILILSPLGIAASIVPGLQGLGKKWWDSLIATVFFGPAAMLMIVIALRFSQEIGSSEFATGATAGAAATSTAGQASIIHQGIFFIPIILMWMAMHIGSQFGIQGASAVMKRAEAVATWGKRQALLPWRATKATAGFAVSPVTTRFRGWKSGIKDRLDGTVVGGKYWKDKAEGAEARAKARAKGIFSEKGMSAEVDKANAQLRDRRAREQEKKWKDDGKTVSEIAQELRSKEATDVEKLAAASFLANEKEGIKDPAVLADALAIANETKKKDLYDKVLASATDDALSMTPDQIRNVRKGYKDAQYQKSKQNIGESATDYADRLREEEKEFDEALDGKFRAKFKKEGKIKVLIDYEIDDNKKRGLAKPHEEVYAKYMDKMKAKEVAQMKGVIDASGDLDAKYAEYIDRRIKNGDWKFKDQQDAFNELDSKGKAAWRKANIDPK